MTLKQIYLAGKKILEKAGKESPAFDAMCLFQKEFGLDRQGLAVHGAEQADPCCAARYLSSSRERAGGRPLQYILGEWPFLDLTLRVGEGVLAPREETGLLVRAAGEALDGMDCGKRALRVADLCGGSGAVALGLGTLLPKAKITSVEWYEDAWRYLTENVERCGLPNVTAQRLDILDPESAARFLFLDGVVSNPPYVETEEIARLQPEVRREPVAALDGGRDGLLFYRAIAQHWLVRLMPGGVAAVEIGETQAGAVCDLFGAVGIGNLRVLTDFNGRDRVVLGYKQ